MKTGSEVKHTERGAAVIEVALMAPWIFFLFVGVLDVGFYCYAAICTQNAARAAALAQAEPTSTLDYCQAALGELRGLPNVNSGTTCGGPIVAVCGGVGRCSGQTAPLQLTCTTTPICADCALDPNYSSNPAACSTTSWQVSVTYQTVPMIPIPGLMMGQMIMTRTAEVNTITP